MSDKVWRLTPYGIVLIQAAFCFGMAALTWVVYNTFMAGAIGPLELPSLDLWVIFPLAFLWSVLLYTFEEDGPTSW